MVGHAHSFSLYLSLSLSVCLDWPRSFSDKNDISPCLSPVRPIHIVYSLTHIVYLGHSLQPVSLFRSHGDPMWSVDLASSHAQNISTRLWLDHLSSSILQPSPLRKAQSDNSSPEHIYLFNECRTILTLSLYLYVSRLTLLSHTVSSTRWSYYLSIPHKAWAIYIVRGTPTLD